MRITKISVKGLFGMFDHEIPLNQESRITIIHGPNGVGKTVLMQMVHGLFDYDYAYIDSVPFEQIQIKYQDGAALTIEHLPQNDDDSAALWLAISSIPEAERQQYLYLLSDADHVAVLYQLMEKNPQCTLLLSPRQLKMMPIDFGEPISMNSEYDSEDRRPGLWGLNDQPRFAPIKTLGGYMHRHTSRRQMFWNSIRGAESGEWGNWSDWYDSANPPRLISTYRLISGVAQGVDEQSASTILEWLQSVKPTISFPKPLLSVEKIKGSELTPEELKDFIDEYSLEEYDRLEMEIEKLNEILAKQSVKASGYATEALEVIKSELEDEQSAYEPDVEAEKERQSIIDLFCDMLNARLLYKSIDLADDYSGIRFIDDRGNEVPFSDLSSGEQQLLVLYYQLLFETEQDTLVMIDEPELSMNVVWQRNFLKDLQRIVELRKFDVLIATHSPEVIFDKWDWTVALGEKASD